MNAEKALNALLAADAPLVAIVGTKRFPAIVPLGTALPFLRYSVVATTRTRAAASNPGLVNVLFQIDCFADAYLAAKTLANAVRVAIERKAGTYASVTVQDVYFENEIDAMVAALATPYIITEYRMYLKET